MTELQQTIYDELNKYTSTEIMREAADSIAKICNCSKAYVLRMIKKKEDSGAKVQIKVTPPEPEPDEDEIEEEPEPSGEPPKEDWEFDFDEPEPAPESDEEEKPKREIPDIPLSEIFTNKNIGMLISTPFRFAADWTGFEGWKLTPEEQKQLAPMGRVLLIKYVPDIMENYFPEVMFAVLVLGIVGSKGKAWRDWEAEQEQAFIAQRKAAQFAEEEKRIKELEEARLRQEAEVPPEPPEPAKPLTKQDAGTPEWLKDGARIG